MLNLNDALEIYRDMKTELQPAIDELNTLEKQIKAHVKETGETGNVDGVSVKIKNGYERTSWDGKALKGYAAAHPEIEQFMKVTTVSPSVTIKVD